MDVEVTVGDTDPQEEMWLSLFMPGPPSPWSAEMAVNSIQGSSGLAEELWNSFLAQVCLWSQVFPRKAFICPLYNISQKWETLSASNY